MKVLTINLDDNGVPDEVMVSMSRDEAIQVALWAGSTPGPTPEMMSISSALNSRVFNTFWDDGVHGAARGDAE